METSRFEMTEQETEIIEDMEKYAGKVTLRGIDKDRYTLRFHHAYALYKTFIADGIHAMNIIFDYGFAKGIQAERNRLKKA